MVKTLDDDVGEEGPGFLLRLAFLPREAKKPPDLTTDTGAKLRIVEGLKAPERVFGSKEG